MNILRAAESFEFAASSTKCKLGVKQSDVIRIEREVSDFIINKKLEIEDLAPVCKVETIKKEK